MITTGDKVLVVGNKCSLGTLHNLKIGSEATVIGVLGKDRYEVRGIASSHGYHVSQTVYGEHIKLITTKETPPTNITSETDSILGSITVVDAKESNVLFMAHLYHGLGMSFRQVAKLTNVHERTVRRRFKKYGIPSRPMNGVK